MRLHLIAIGGSVMHNLALALKGQGHVVTGSDDEISDPSLSRLKAQGLLPEKMGWDESKITADIDVVILGMHARADNPELRRAQELQLMIMSYPEFIYRQSREKKRVVVGGSHGKTTITSMVMHVLKKLELNFDYLVGAKLEGFEQMVRLSGAPMIVLEGDEYLSSAIDRRPKFHLYHPQVALVSGIAWDHINVFPTFENYLEQFKIFVENLDPNAFLIYCREDEVLQKLVEESDIQCVLIPYALPAHEAGEGETVLLSDGARHGVSVFGNHNLMNLEGARNICNLLGIDDESFYYAIKDFKGAGRRLELIAETGKTKIYRDFAHAPSKVKATVEAVKNQFNSKKLIAVFELHTFSSLNKKFLSHYAGTMDNADEAVIYFDPKTVEHKKLELITTADAGDAFKKQGIKVFSDPAKLQLYLEEKDLDNSVLLLMSSGTFGGIDFGFLLKDKILG